MEPLEALRWDLARHPPRRVPRIRGFVHASVAIALAPEDDDVRVLLIGRAHREGDRWSGDVAFPGGLASAEDATGASTAIREAREEVGLVLDAPLFALSDRLTLAAGRMAPMRIRPFVFRVEGTEALAPDPREVAAIYRPTLTELAAAPKTTVERRLGPLRHRFEGRAIGEHVLWGLTAGLIDEVRTRLARAR